MTEDTSLVLVGPCKKRTVTEKATGLDDRGGAWRPPHEEPKDATQQYAQEQESEFQAATASLGALAFLMNSASLTRFETPAFFFMFETFPFTELTDIPMSFAIPDR